MLELLLLLNLIGFLEFKAFHAQDLFKFLACLTQYSKY